MSSGVNNIGYMPLVADTTPECGNADKHDLSWYFRYSENEVKLLIEKVRNAKGGRLGSGDPTDADILDTVKPWYNGYRIGRIVGKFNPLASMSFLVELSKNRTLEDAAQSFWGNMGCNSTITTITLRNRGIVWKLGHYLIKEYKDASRPAMYLLASDYRPSQDSMFELDINLPAQDTSSEAASSQSTQAEPSKPASNGYGCELGHSAELITLGNYSIPRDPEFSEFQLSKLVTLFLYTGYLILRDSKTFRIPDGELLSMWQEFKLTAAFNSSDANTKISQHDKLLQSICNGDMRVVYEQVKAIMDQLSNHFRGVKEAVSADTFRAFFLTNIEYGRHVKDGMTEVHSIEGECGAGNVDWHLVIPGRFVGRKRPIYVTFEFKRLDKKHKLDLVRRAHGALR
ncbi:hypothetical protein EV175_002492 [Coemansia sp. RSA 1933]|nr:hypothetical protein EV175_002492 [Coemansia sp. RSA 1933]